MFDNEVSSSVRTHVGVLVGGVVRAAVGVAVAAPARRYTQSTAHAPELSGAACRVVHYIQKCVSVRVSLLVCKKLYNILLIGFSLESLDSKIVYLLDDFILFNFPI